SRTPDLSLRIRWRSMGRSFLSKIVKCPPADDLVSLDQLVGRDVGRRFHPLVQGTKVLITLLPQLFKTVDDEVDLLEIINHVCGAHHAFQIEGDAIGRIALKRKYTFANR